MQIEREQPFSFISARVVIHYFYLIHLIKSTVEKNRDNKIKDTPIITGVYVQAEIISPDVIQALAPIGLERVAAISCPFEKPK